MALDIQGLADCFLFLFDNFRIGACLSDKDCSALITLFMLRLTSSSNRLLNSIASRSLKNKSLLKREKSLKSFVSWRKGLSLYRKRVNDLLYQLNIFLLLLFFEARLCRSDQSALWCDL